MTKYTDSIYTTASLPLGGDELWLAVQPGTAAGNSVQLQVNMILTTGGLVGQFPIKNNSSVNYSATWGSLSSLMSASTGISLAGSTTVSVALATAAPLSVLGVTGSTQTNPLPIVGTGAQVLRVNDAGTAVTFGAINLGSSAAVTGTLPVSNLSYIGSLPGLSALVNASSLTAAATAVVGVANDVLTVNAAATTVKFQSISNLIDNAAGSAQGMVLLRSATSWTSLGPGTAGQILQTQGAGANPRWIGGMTLLNTLSPNGVASTNDTSSFTATYRNYLLTFENVCPATNTAALQMTVCTTGSAFITGSYVSVAQTNVNSTLSTDTSTSVILLSGTRATTSVSTTTLFGVSGWVYVNSAAIAGIGKQITGELGYQSTASTALATTSFGVASVNGLQNLSTALTGINISFSAGNIATGTIKIYGLL